MHTRSTRTLFMLMTMATASMSILAQNASEAMIDLSCATIVADAHNTVKPKTVAMLQEEIASRTGLWLAVSDIPLDSRTPTIILGVKGDVPGGKATPPEGLAIPGKPEGFAIWTDTSNMEAPKVYLMGNDARGTLFAVGRLLRLLTMRQGELTLSSATRIATAPTYEFRGHQMGYRNTANTYDLWNIRQYEQYIRDMVIFGTNSVELIQEGDPYVRDTRLLAMSQWSMNLRIAKLLDDYGLDVWLWYSLLSVVKDPKVYQAELDLREEFIQEMPRIDGIMIPGGDPGVNHPDDLMPWSGDFAKLLHKRFPNAGLYISNQKFGVEERDAFYGYINDKQPKWLAGVAYGPGSEDTVKVQRERTPSQYKIRRYPDITHNIRCQYPVPGWDGKHAQSLDREGVNPRPAHSQLVHNAWDEYANGFVSYSDGAHDDMNKMVWSSLAWDPNAGLDQILVDYGRVFFGEDLGPEVAKGLTMLEDNMKGFLLTNEGIDAALVQWRKIGRLGGPELENNWRYQMYLFRALFDAYIRARLIAETEYEREAYLALSRAGDAGVKQAIEDSRAALARADNKRIRPELRAEIEELGVKLFKLIGFQLSLDEPYLARNPERGALLDKVDIPLNDRLWLERQFEEVLAMTSQDEQLARLNLLVNWENPGPGGFYDDLGNTAKQPHLVRQTRYEEDPGFIYGPQESHFRSMDNKTKQLDNTLRYSWLDQCETVYYQPLLMHYSDLDPSAQYKVRVTYFGRYGNPMRLVADEKYEVHGANEAVRPPWPEEFDVPREATQDGQLDLAWHLVEGRGCQVAEVWLIKK
ncbi:MAG: hypothetical protein IT364_23205 [Candidatus Hydrogenedentes bacterium]|nr:hypothetical protein [Candidatus Hydrogenedentota bacterium]